MEIGQRFYSGQRVVAVDAMPQSYFKNGKEYTVSDYQYRVNLVNGLSFWYIGIVGYCNGDCWFRPGIFAPIEETFQAITLLKVLEEETKLISVN